MGNKILICSAAGDDPGAMVNKLLLKKYGETIIKGIKRLQEYSGAGKAYLYIPENYQEEADKIKISANGIEIITGKDSPVCHDATALIAAMSGNYIRPYYLNDGILRYNESEVNPYITIADAINAAEGKNKRIFLYISGVVEQEGLIEAREGQSLEEVIACAEDLQKDREIKGVLLGGIIGRFIGKESFGSYTLQNDNIALNRSIEIISSNICGIGFSKNLAEICHSVSCGKCPLCREGTAQLLSYLNDIVNGKGKSSDIDFLVQTVKLIEAGAFCGFGRGMAAMLYSALDVFAPEFEDHIKRKKCPAGVCKAFMNLAILPDKCNGCTECLDVCDEDAIEGKMGFIHMINENNCTRCGKCVEACGEKAVVLISGNKPRLPKRLTRAGQFN
jgi:NADH-quinone oxidoreductase subunit F